MWNPRAPFCRVVDPIGRDLEMTETLNFESVSALFSEPPFGSSVGLF